MPSSVREMLAAANAALPRLNPAEAREMMGNENVLIVDVGDAPEFASGGGAALNGKTLKDLGYQSVYNAGGFKELADAGRETEPA